VLARVAADLVLLLHLAFVAFALLGGLAALRWRRAPWIHLPVLAWSVAIEWIGWTCPLTPLENALRRAAGDAGYAGGFVEHYLLPLLYPGALTPTVRFALGAVLLAVNALVYGYLLLHRR
jgi:hypothetical protein